MISRLVTVFLSATFLGLVFTFPSAKIKAAENPTKTPCAIDWIPKTSTAFGIMLKNKEQLDLVLNSKAFKKLAELGATKMLLEKIKEYPAGIEENKSLISEVLKVGGELFSHEVVFVAGPNVPKAIRVFSSAINASQMAPLTLLLQGNTDQGEISKAQLSAMMQAFAESPDEITVPEILIAFKLKEKKTALELLKKIEEKIPLLEATDAKLKGAVKKEKISGNDFITLKIKGSIFPVNEIEIEGLEEEQLKKFKAAISKLTFTAAIGIKDDYLVFSMGPDTKFLASIGKTEALASSKELAVLSKHSGKNLIGLQYISKEMVEISSGKQEELSEKIKGMLVGANLPKDLLKRVEKDVDAFIADSIPFMPKVGARVGLSFISDRGFESVSYDYTTNLPFEASKPLGLLENFGGNPIFASVLRGKTDDNQIKFIAKWAGIAYTYFNDFAIPVIPEDQKAQVTEFLKKVEPAFTKLAKITLNELIPAMRDGQAAIVLDAKLGNKQWSDMLLKSKKELSILEPAFILGISDKAKFEAAIKGYREGLNEIIKAAAGFDPTGTLAAIKIPAPETKDLKSGKAFYYPIPMLNIIDKRLQPTASLGEEFSALTLSFDHAERLLKKTPLVSKLAKLALVNKNLAGFCLFDNLAMMAFLTPWVDYGLEQLPPGIDEAFGVKKQVKTFFDVMGTFKGIVCSSFMEDGKWVSHTISVWKDLE